MSIFSDRLAAYLGAHPEWNPAKLAVAAGLDNSAVRKILQQGYSPRLDTVQKIADALGEPIELFTSDAPPGGLEEIQRLFALLTPEEQATIRTAVEALAARHRADSR